MNLRKMEYLKHKMCPSLESQYSFDYIFEGAGGEGSFGADVNFGAGGTSSGPSKFNNQITRLIAKEI